ncbi:MAG: DUF2264 domain-containing protein [Verrucomicrobia bacterium]|nr:DUF2264 domain-containing protein [Verrucomicrobiota bacterium]
MSLLPFAANPLRTRDDVQRLARDLTTPILPHFSPGRAQVKLGATVAHFGERAGWLEGFARPLWGLVPLAAGGGAFDHWELWRQGIAAGTDPAHPEYWGAPGDYDQRSVEMAAFGFALALAPAQVWEPLPPDVRDRLVTWLNGINRAKLVDSNWRFFRVLVNLGLSRCGRPAASAQVADDLAKIESFHLGYGWYSDGADSPHRRDGRTGDYYVPMAFQFYGLIHAKLSGDPARLATTAARATAFAQDFQHYFAADGSALPFGRSLAYRFAQGAFWGALAFADVEALPWPVIKGLYLRHLRWWMRQPIFSETGLLSIGYTYPNLLMAESYNSPGSPYWALKALLPLALPETHPFWQAEEAPLPPRPAVHTVPGAGLILATDPDTRDVTAITPGQPVLDWPRNAPHKYSKAAYSTRFGFAVPSSVTTPVEGGFDSELSLSDDGRFFRRRDLCLDATVRDGVAYSRWQPWPDVKVHSWILADATGHVRVHCLRTGRTLWSMEAGFSVPWTDRTTLRTEPGAVQTPAGFSQIRNLSGSREPGHVDLGANSHLLSSLASMPVLRASHEPGECWLACRVSGRAQPFANIDPVFTFSSRPDGSECTVLRDGHAWWRWTDATHPCGDSSTERLASLKQPA